MRVGLTAWVAHYLEACRVRHAARGSLRNNGYVLRQFVLWCAERDIQNPDELDRRVLENYQRWLFHYRKHNGQPLKLPTQQLRLVVVRGFCLWLAKEGVIAHNPAAALELPRKPEALPSGALKLAQVEAVIALANLETPMGLRDRAMMETLFSTGVRRAELTGLRVMDLDLEAETLWIRQGKGGKQRLLPIGSRAVRWLEKYLQDARPLLSYGHIEEGWLFLNYKGEPLSANGLTKRMSAYLRQAGINQRGACHLFRHTMATLMLEGGADIRYIQEMLGHRRLTTTQLYTKVSPKRLKEVHDQTHPAAKLSK